MTFLKVKEVSVAHQEKLRSRSCDVSQGQRGEQDRWWLTGGVCRAKELGLYLVRVERVLVSAIAGGGFIVLKIFARP